MKIIFKTTTCLLGAMISFSTLHAQSPVQDKAVNGQLKRMVATQWNDWQPTPETNWLGIPKNPQGWLFWRVAHNAYYHGGDKRPFKTGGPFTQNYAALALQYTEDKRIRDSTKGMYETHLSTFTNMSGGAFDLPYNLFFKKKFDAVYNSIVENLSFIASKQPVLFNELQSKEGYQQYMEWFDRQKDDIEIIHESFVDKGVRMESYLDILNKLRKQAAGFASYLQMHSFLAKLPSQEAINQSGKAAGYNTGTDKKIVEQILKTFRY